MSGDHLSWPPALTAGAQFWAQIELNCFPNLWGRRLSSPSQFLALTREMAPSLPLFPTNSRSSFSGARPTEVACTAPPKKSGEFGIHHCINPLTQRKMSEETSLSSVNGCIDSIRDKHASRKNVEYHHNIGIPVGSCSTCCLPL